MKQNKYVVLFSIADSQLGNCNILVPLQINLLLVELFGEVFCCFGRAKYLYTQTFTASTVVFLLLTGCKFYYYYM